MLKYITAIFIATLPLLSQVNFTEIEVGSQPSELITSSDGTLHVFCLGKDVLFDGIFDETTDEMPSWWTVKVAQGEYIAEKVKDFDFLSFGFPFYPGFDSSTQNVFLPLGNKVESYNLLTQEKVQTIVAAGNLTSCFAFDNTLISTTGVSNELGVVTFTDLETFEDEFIYNVGENPGKTVISEIDGEPVAGTFCSGDYSSGQYSLHIFYPETGESTSITVLDIPNDIIGLQNLEGGFALVSNGEHAIQNIVNETSVANITTETSGFDGPRRGSFYNIEEGGFAFSTYAGDLRILDTDGSVVTIIPSPENKRVEDFIYTIDDDSEFIALAQINLADDFYTPNNTIAIYNGPITSVNTNEFISEIFPNPASDFITIKSDNEIIGKKYHLYSLFGSKIQSGIISSSEYRINLDELNLSAGKYFVIIESDKNEVLNFIVYE